MQRFIVVLVTLLVALLAPRAYAQSNVLSQEERAVFAQMDASLHGYWEGHAGDNDGMKYDPQAIACMVNKCSQIRQQYHQDPKQLRDSANFGSCYDAHLARIKKPGYTRLTNPPPIYVLGCNVIAAQANSTDDRVYAAVNGHQRNRPSPVVVRVARRGIEPTAAERAYLHAQMTKAPASSASGRLVDDNPYKDAPSAKPTKSNVVRKPVAVAAKPANDNPYLDAPAPVAARPSKARASGSSSVVKQYGDLGDKLVLVSANDEQARIYVREGGQFYRIRASFLAEKYDVDWKRVFEANQYADTIGACWHGNKVALDPDRMKARSYDKAKLEGPVDTKFMEACDGEFNFALQAGQTIVLAAKSATPSGGQSPVQQEPSSPQAQDQNPPPAPTATAPPEESATPPATSATAMVAGPPNEPTEVPAVASTPPVESVVVPPASSAITVTVNGKQRVAPTRSRTVVWINNWWPLLLLGAVAAGLVYQGFMKRRRARQPHWGAGPNEPTLVGHPPSGPPSAKT